MFPHSLNTMHLTSSGHNSATYLLSFLYLSGYTHFLAQGDVCSCQTYGGCNACLSPDACTIINVALGKPANISSLYNNSGYKEVSGPACLAVNGNTRTTFQPINKNPDSPACVHTADDDLLPFWEVDLGQQYVITNVTIYGREENNRNMLRNAKVIVDNELCYTFAPDYYRPIITEIACNAPLTGRKVRIEKDNDLSFPFLALCQVQVWACASGAYGNSCKQTCGRCQAKSPCSIYDGRCDTGCEAGYQLPLCKEFCNNNSYGLNCNNTCGSCSEGTSCNPVSGKCPLGCKPGYQGTYCNDSCACAADTSSGSASCGGPVAGAVVGSFASCAITVLLGIVLMRYRERKQHKRQSFLPAPIQTVDNPSLGEVSRPDPAVPTDLDNSNVNPNGYEVLEALGCMNISSDASSSPYVNIK